MLKKLQAYTTNPDDDTIRIKEKIKEMFMHCPELLYALHSKELESELFNKDGTLNEDGEWDRYFGDNSLIRPFLFIPQTQSEVNNYLCYQVSFTETPRYNNTEKMCLITFTILVNGKDRIDNSTGIPRHDLIASIVRELMAWSGIAMSSAVPVEDRESITDNDFLVRTLVYQAQIPNSIVTTKGGLTYYSNKGKP